MATAFLADFPELAYLTREDLEDLLADPQYFQAIFHSLARVKNLYQGQAELGMANESIANNNLRLQESLYQLRSETQDAFDEAKALEARWKELDKEQKEVYQELWVNGVSQGHLTGIRVPDYDGPITDVTSNDIICNGGINPYHTPISTTVIPVPAGAQVTAEWHHTLTSANTGDSSDPIDASHKGPVIAYLAKVPSATQSSVTGLQWFKIYHDGLDSSGKWGVDRLISNQGKVTFTIPSCIAAGQYLLRVELIGANI
ncbi:hypothetical protein H0H87_009107 [Tephrocybe sp. NHM501043]|nr:hypothetical protein H0H87_009107 [Tephrocybe sp. NHM501043]